MKASTLLFTVSTLCAAANSTAAILQFTEGKLIGALKVDVGGIDRDVRFIDGPFTTVFPGWSSSNFYFTTAAEALNASQALLDQVLLNVPGYSIDDDPSLVAGVESNLLGVIYTPFVVRASNSSAGPVQLYTAWGAQNMNPFHYGPNNPDTLTIDYREISYDSSSSSTQVFAVWSTHVPMEVPEPPGMVILALGIAGVLSRRSLK